MAFTQSDIDQLKSAMALGALEVRYADGRKVVYRSLADMQRTLQMMQDEVTPPTAIRSGPMLTLVQHNRD